MSIKKLFDSAESNINISEYQNEKDKYEFVESADNAKQISVKNNAFTPQIDYSDPKNFIKYGSAYHFYEGALSRISEYYPYDGSDSEKNKFYNELLDGEKYIFNHLYPTSTGYALLSADGWGTLSVSNSAGYGLPSSLEYITFKGGPLTSSGNSLVERGPDPQNDKIHSSNIYDENLYQTHGLPTDYGDGTRLSNLRSNFDTGVTVEFWLKKDGFNVANATEREVIADLWNNYASSSVDYGRLRIELNGAASASPFLITAHSGNVSGSVMTSSIGSGLTVSSLTSWAHYAFTFYNTGSNFIAKLYQNGVLNDTNTYSGNINELNSKGMMGRIGALLTAPSGAADSTLLTTYVGAGKLSASMDDFRFWKVKRNSQQISRNWFTNVNGGVNTDISNTTLGVYYKFNEGIVGSSSVDNVVLDYGGRLSNGAWTGYDSYSRDTGSAIVSASAGLFEYEDPIVRKSNIGYLNLSSSLMASGTFYDLNNNASFVNYAPSWILEEHEDQGNTNLNIVSHIIGSYFDKLYCTIREVPKLRHANYVTSALAPIPFARHLPQSLGILMPDTFIDSTIVERLLGRNDTELFESNLEDTKNLIYLNLYNNLTSIFKSKGTAKSIRNVFRCFNIDDSLLEFKQYAHNTTYELQNNLKQKKETKKFLNFNTASNTQAVVYQASYAGNADSSGYIYGSVGTSDDGVENSYGATIEAQVQFPFYLKNNTSVSRDPLNISLFGMYTTHTASTPSLNGTDTTFVSGNTDYANFQVFAVRDDPKSKNVYFKLTSSNIPYALPELTSSTFFDVYNNTNWNLSVRLKPSNYPFAGLVSGSNGYAYDVIFKGTNNQLGVVANSFEVSSSIIYASGSNFLKYPKRMYVGARRENITGAILQNCDVLFANAKYWTKYLDDESLLQHSNNVFNSGISGSYRNLSPLQLSSSNLDLINLNTLALDWNFQQVTASNAAGNVLVQDFSSGSTLIRDNYGWIGSISGYQHTGWGYGFETSTTKVIDKKAINIYEFVDPEQVVDSDMIKIMNNDDKVYENLQTVPSYLFTLEKSMQASISVEMLKFFAGIIDFNNVIGEPVNRYRSRYKNLEKLREIFFRRVTKTSDVEKFIDYYKWFDDALSRIISNLIPASADYVRDTMNIIEPHVLERDKYESKFPTLEFKEPTIEGSIKGINEKVYDWEFGSSPVGATSITRNTTHHMLYWGDRAKRSDAEITSGDANIDSQRETIRQVVITKPFLSRSLPRLNTPAGVAYNPSAYSRRSFQKLYRDSVIKTTTIHGGVNFPLAKDIHLTYNALAPAGPVNREGGVFVPQNVLLSFMEDLVKQPIDNDPKLATYKNRRHVGVLHGRDWEDGFGYKNVKSNIIFPFNMISSSVSGGYQADVQKRVSGSIMITNLHNDVYGPMMEKPMQGPFTEYAVGGHQSRHIALNKGVDRYYNRPEAWKLLVGTCVDTATTIEDSGAIGMVGADYPWPEANAVGATPYPMTASQKAVYYRDFMAKRPVNIRNIKHTTGSTILGNYNNNYEVVSTVGAYANPRGFIENQPALPSAAFQNNMTSSTSIRTFLDIRRDDNNHTSSVNEYSLSYLTSAVNKSVITSKFSAPGGMEVMTPGYMDIRSAEYSAYNNINYRNLSVRGVFGTSGLPSGSSGSVGRPPTGSGTTAMTVNDIHSMPFALRSHLARHTGRFGRDSLLVAGNSAATDGPGANYNQSGSMFKIPRNRLDQLIYQSTETNGDVQLRVVSGSVYDNYFVSHQVPRSTLNYSWIKASYDRFNERYGIVRPDFRVLIMSSSERPCTSSYMINSIDFVSASEVVSVYAPGTATRIFGEDARYVAARKAHTSFVGLNQNVIDPINTSSATVGTSTDALDYLNTSLIDHANGFGTASILNAMILNRQGPYGWPSWRQVRQRDNKLVRNYINNNQLHFVSSTGSYDSQAQFEMPPVSLRGRTLTVTIEDLNTELYVTDGSSINLLQTYKADFSNNYVYYNLDKFEDQFDLNYFGKTTAAEQLIQIGNSPGFALDWIIYTENIFPSQRNEFLSQSRNKIGFDNKYWRDSNAERVTLGDTFNNTQNIVVSQSAWVLDAPSDFLTRTGPSFADLLSGTAYPASSSAQLIVLRDSLRNSSSAGELQNTYFTYFTSSSRPTGTDAKDYEKGAVLTPGALYARKQTITSPKSIVTPSGMLWPHTGASVTGPFHGSAQIGWGAGEAKWEAGEKAGVVGMLPSRTRDSLTSTPLQFVSTPSQPWFNSYDDFNYLINKVSNAKEFAIVPEYRSSTHAIDYASLGTTSEKQYNTFSIPETEISSSQDEFYIDYSNSEFLKEFLNINDLSSQNLKAKEIRLVCSGTIRFNPYKSFYPAQRTTDLVERFYSSYSNRALFFGAESISSGTWGNLGYGNGVSGSIIKSLYQPLFAPGILFNSIKSGLAVDYPIITDFDKVTRSQFGDSVLAKKDNWAITTNTGSFRTNQSFWDKRLDFETIIYPEAHIDGIEFIDMDSHPSCSATSASYDFKTNGDQIYSSMVSNFLAETMNFYLRDSEPTAFKSQPIDTVAVVANTPYMARIKLRRSMSGSRDYSNEYGSTNVGFSGNPYSHDGGKLLRTASAGTAFDFSAEVGASFSLPQDPQRNTGSYHETFTMYSRPTAFGSPLAGLGNHSTGTINTYSLNTVCDSFVGYNSAYTPPYYNGEAWCDVIYRPTASAEVSLEQILMDSQKVYWRMDPGYASSSFTTATNPAVIRRHKTALIFDDSINGVQSSPYGGPFINDNSMQLSASFNLFGIEEVPTRHVNVTTKEETVFNTSTRQRWVISPKFETPMLNFNDLSAVRPLVNTEVAIPTNFGAASLPRGMWHQFGIIEPDPSKGIFIEVQSIPQKWLKNHYDVTMNDTVYNNFDAANSGSSTFLRTESLAELLKISKNGPTRLGELKQELTVYEAVVAVPYVIETLEPSLRKDISLTEAAKDYKKFISIPQERYDASLTSSIGTSTGDSLEAAGASIRRQVNLMDKYIFPPELDFVNNTEIDPIAMYIFEFEYSFDEDDLSYMWQNLAPRNYQQITQQSTTVSHELIDTELLTEENLTENENLRWMVFKVKQRSQKLFTDMGTNIEDVLEEARTTAHGNVAKKGSDLPRLYNWPYDYLSFVEKISIDAEILFKADATLLEQYAANDLKRNAMTSAEAPAPVTTSPNTTITTSPSPSLNTTITAGADPSRPQSALGTSAPTPFEYPTFYEPDIRVAPPLITGVGANQAPGTRANRGLATQVGYGPRLTENRVRTLVTDSARQYKTATGITTSLVNTALSTSQKAPGTTPVLSQEALDRARERLKNN